MASRRNPLSPEQSFAKAANAVHNIAKEAREIKILLASMEEFEEVPFELKGIIEDIEGAAEAASDIFEEMVE